MGRGTAHVLTRMFGSCEFHGKELFLSFNFDCFYVFLDEYFSRGQRPLVKNIEFFEKGVRACGSHSTMAAPRVGSGNLREIENMVARAWAGRVARRRRRRARTWHLRHVHRLPRIGSNCSRTFRETAFVRRSATFLSESTFKIRRPKCRDTSLSHKRSTA